MGLHQKDEISRLLGTGRFLDGSIGRGVPLFLLAEAHAQEHPQPVRFQRQGGAAPREQKDLLRAGLTNPRKLPEDSCPFRGGLTEDLLQVASRHLLRELRTVEHAIDPILRVHSPIPNRLSKSLSRGGKDLSGEGADPGFQGLEHRFSLAVGDKVGDVFAQNHLEGIGRILDLRTTVGSRESLDDPSQRRLIGFHARIAGYRRPP